jgi:hypothetical protein
MADSQDPILKAVEQYYSVPRSSDRQTTYCLTFESVADFSRGLLEEACKIILDPDLGKKFPVLWDIYEHTEQSLEEFLVGVLREHFNLGGNKSQQP